MAEKHILLSSYSHKGMNSKQVKCWILYKKMAQKQTLDTNYRSDQLFVIKFLEQTELYEGEYKFTKDLLVIYYLQK